MKDDYECGIYEANEYDPGGYPQIKKRKVHAVSYKLSQKHPVTSLWGITLFGVMGVFAACLAVIWLM